MISAGLSPDTDIFPYALAKLSSAAQFNAARGL
jgi:hypothetical protein